MIAAQTGGAAASHAAGWQQRLEEARLAELQASRELKRAHEREKYLQGLLGATWACVFNRV